MVEQLAAERQADLTAEMDMQDGKDEKTDDCPLHYAPKHTRRRGMRYRAKLIEAQGYHRGNTVVAPQSRRSGVTAGAKPQLQRFVAGALQHAAAGARRFGAMRLSALLSAL
jgi:hypothetical protein